MGGSLSHRLPLLQRAGSVRTGDNQPTLAEVVVASAGRVPKTFKSRLQRVLQGKRPTSPRDFVSFKHSPRSWNDRLPMGNLLGSARSYCLAGRRQKSLHVEEPCPSPAQLLLVAHSDARSSSPMLLRGFPQSTRFGAVQPRSFEECESYFYFPPRSDRY